jgi:hypothetical protein
MMRPGRGSPPNRTAEAAYRFAHRPGLASEPTGPDLAQIWRSPARSGQFLFFSCAISICYLNAANKIVLKILWTSENYDSNFAMICAILSIPWYCMFDF